MTIVIHTKKLKHGGNNCSKILLSAETPNLTNKADASGASPMIEDENYTESIFKYTNQLKSAPTNSKIIGSRSYPDISKEQFAGDSLKFYHSTSKLESDPLHCNTGELCRDVHGDPFLQGTIQIFHYPNHCR